MELGRPGTPAGLGLVRMKERARLVNGTLQIQGAIGFGDDIESDDSRGDRPRG
jgi:signal transduction histidine kinase